MKNRKLFLAAMGLCLTLAPVTAQTVYDAAKIADKDLNGTARFVGMGGAMSALGGDISTIGTNPAGIGIYRSHDVMTSFSLSSFGTDANYMGNNLSTSKMKGSYDNLGFVLSTKIGNKTTLRYVPEINFRLDDTFEEVDRIEKLLHDPKVQRDLKAKDEE